MISWKEVTADKRMRQRTIAYLWLFIGMLTMLVSASFAWFSVSATPCVNDMAIFVNSPVGLELAVQYTDSDELWGQNINFSDLVSTAAPLKPVSWSDRDQCFKAPRYGLDGRRTGKWKPLNDQENSNRSGNDPYYVVATFYARTGTACTVSLADAYALNDGLSGAGTYVIGAPVWNAEKEIHEDAGRGAEYAIRIGFRVTQIDPNTGANVGASKFLLYEPNAKVSENEAMGYVNTRSIDGTDTLVSRDRLLVQTPSSWSETTPVRKDTTVKTLGNFITDKRLFALEAQEMVRIDMYIWMEGQDVDSYGLPEDATLFANIQFKTDSEAQTGLEEIPGAGQ